MRDKHIKARFAELEADLNALRESVQGHAKQEAVDAAHAAARSAQDKAEKVETEFAGLKESIRQAAAVAAAPAGDPEPQDEAVTPISKPRTRRASSS